MEDYIPARDNQLPDRVVITLDWPTDKWVGHGGWLKFVEALATVVTTADLGHGKAVIERLVEND